MQPFPHPSISSPFCNSQVSELALGLIGLSTPVINYAEITVRNRIFHTGTMSGETKMAKPQRAEFVKALRQSIGVFLQIYDDVTVPKPVRDRCKRISQRLKAIMLRDGQEV